MLAVVIAGLGTYLFRSREPSYQGKSLSAWLRSPLDLRGLGDGGQAKAAVRNIGTNAIPSLLRMLRETNSPFTIKMRDLSQRFDLPRFIFVPKTAEDENYFAAIGFEWLGSVASNAAPALIDIYHENISGASQYTTLLSLIAISQPPQYKAVLNEALTNNYTSVRWFALSQLTPTNQPGVAVPLLIKSLNDPSPRFREMAARKLRQFGTNALPAVPMLVRLACSAPSSSKIAGGYAFEANRTLCLVDPQTAAKVLTNGFWTYEKYTNGLALTNGTAAKRDQRRRRLEPSPAKKQR